MTPVLREGVLHHLVQHRAPRRARSVVTAIPSGQRGSGGGPAELDQHPVEAAQVRVAALFEQAKSRLVAVEHRDPEARSLTVGGDVLRPVEQEAAEPAAGVVRVDEVLDQLERLAARDRDRRPRRCRSPSSDQTRRHRPVEPEADLPPAQLGGPRSERSLAGVGDLGEGAGVVPGRRASDERRGRLDGVVVHAGTSSSSTAASDERSAISRVGSRARAASPSRFTQTDRRPSSSRRRDVVEEARGDVDVSGDRRPSGRRTPASGGGPACTSRSRRRRRSRRRARRDAPSTRRSDPGRCSRGSPAASRVSRASVRAAGTSGNGSQEGRLSPSASRRSAGAPSRSSARAITSR